MTPEQIKLIKQCFNHPFRYDKTSGLLIDSDDEIIIRIEAYSEDAIDALGELVAELLNERLKG